jgi:hypothetical protein
MTIDDMELVGRLKEAEPLREEAFEQARALLRAAIAVEGNARVAPASPHSHRRRRTLVSRGVIALGIAAAVTAAAVWATSRTPAKVSPERVAVGASKPRHANGPLMRLADYITANDSPPPGNATLVIRTQNYPNQASIPGADLYTDSGEYFYAPTESGLPSAIADNDNIGDGMFAREVAAAVYAVNGNLSTARQDMANAPFPGGVAPAPPSAASAAAQKAAIAAKAKALGLPVPVESSPVSTAAQTDNYIWEDSLDALSAGAGNPQVRAGVLRILATLPEVTVTNTTADGQPALTLTASAPALPTDYQEALTINAATGVPVGFVGGTPGQTPGVTVTYRVSRVTLSDIAAGQF